MVGKKFKKKNALRQPKRNKTGFKRKKSCRLATFSRNPNGGQENVGIRKSAEKLSQESYEDERRGGEK